MTQKYYTYQKQLIISPELQQELSPLGLLVDREVRMIRDEITFYSLALIQKCNFDAGYA